MNAGRGPPVERLYIEADKLGNAQSAGECQMQHGAIAYAKGGSSIGSIEQRLHLNRMAELLRPPAARSREYRSGEGRLAVIG
jgi:hypothetical protein